MDGLDDYESIFDEDEDDYLLSMGDDFMNEDDTIDFDYARTYTDVEALERMRIAYLAGESPANDDGPAPLSQRSETTYAIADFFLKSEPPKRRVG
jgi:hypothetical protein